MAKYNKIKGVGEEDTPKMPVHIIPGGCIVTEYSGAKNFIGPFYGHLSDEDYPEDGSVDEGINEGLEGDVDKFIDSLVKDARKRQRRGTSADTERIRKIRGVVRCCREMRRHHNNPTEILKIVEGGITHYSVMGGIHSLPRGPSRVIRPDKDL